ncbi:MAG TPA: hypothetical protein VHC18_21970 [Amycolatopsis sp.]|nr:hypothetical protein [Amycolatopsis sp.]
MSAAEVAERVAQGRVNDVPARASRSAWEIVRSNVFTRINAIVAVLGASADLARAGGRRVRGASSSPAPALTGRPGSGGRRTRPGSRQKRAGSRWSTPSCATGSTPFSRSSRI